MKSLTSINERVLLSPPDVSKGLESNVQSGFAKIKQKTELVGLTVLMDAKTQNGFFHKGDVVYIKEMDMLGHDDWAKKTHTSSAVINEKGEKIPFVIANASLVVMHERVEADTF